ncbi:MAG: nitroreductase [Clostridia bacterium]|nr:nitroreductase [Clostridia bacterium]
MTDYELMLSRHSVRSYLDKPIEEEKVRALREKTEEVNRKSGLHIALFTEEPKCFKVSEPGYGIFKNCKNYFAMVGPSDADEKIGYYGEELVLFAQSLGLNTCWAAMSYKKGGVDIKPAKGEKLHIVIALGYGETQGHERKSKSISEVSNAVDSSPEWFINGVKAALTAPTAINQQRFRLKLEGNKVSAKAGLFVYTKLDLGIVKYHFELGAGKENFEWAE